VIAALVLATAAVKLDRHVFPDGAPSFLLGHDPNSARELVGTIASSTFNFTGIVFSLTILVLQLTSSQYSSRVLRTFLQDRTTQFALGMFAGTFTFAIRVLPSIVSAPEHSFAPPLATTFAFLFALVSIGVFLVYLDHTAQSLRVVSIIRSVAREGRRTIERRFPERAPFGHEAAPRRPEGRARIVSSDDEPGVVTHVDEHALVELARARDLIVEVIPPVGTFVPAESLLFRVWGEGPVTPGELRCLVSIGLERTPDQDPLFAIRELVDIAERALSPGVNDPTTAVQALDAIHDLLRRIVRRADAPSYRTDAEGTVRVILHPPSWSHLVRVGIGEIRRYGASSQQVVRRIHELLFDLIEQAPPSRRPPLEEQLALVESAIDEHFSDRGERAFERHETADEH
jgi:uncharacterized membrane protein